jgi:prolipoprotein diacylglyceryltransferase
MEALFVIPHFLDAPVYALAYAACFLIGSGMLMREGLRRGWEPEAVVTLICATAFGAIIGSKLLTIPFAAWVGGPDFLPEAPGKTFLGGVLGGFLAVEVTRRLLGMSHSVVDASVWAILLLAPLGRVGCLLAGCCFGRPAETYLAVSYGAGSQPHHAHLAEGWIAAGAETSLPVHPVPLYEITFFCLAAVVVWRLRDRALADGVRFHGLVLGYALFRFVGEFFRHSSTLVDGLSSVQVGLLPVIVGVGAFLVVRNVRPPTRPVREVCAVRVLPLAALAAMALLLWSMRGWLSPIEVIVAFLLFCSAILWMLFARAAALVQHRRRILPVTAALLIPLGAVVSDTTNVRPIETRKSYVEFGASGVFSRYVRDMVIGEEEGCSGPQYQYAPVDHTQRVAGIDVRLVEQQGNRTTTWGVRMYGGMDVQNKLLTPVRFSEVERPIGAVNPYIILDGRHVGVGGGLHLGQMVFRPDDAADNVIFVYPMLAVRFGRLDGLYMDVRIGDGIPGGSPAMPWQFGGGLGLNVTPTEQLGLRAGASENGIYVNPSMRFADRYTVVAHYTSGSRQSRRTIYELTASEIGIGVRYRVPLRQRVP